MTQPDEPRRKWMVLASTVAVTLVLALIVLFAAFSPPSPEGVVARMLDSIARQDTEAFQKYVEQGSGKLQNLDSSRWEIYWNYGEELFREYRIDEVQVSGNEAEVLVYFGPGLIQEEIFFLSKINGRWKVIK